MKQQKIALPPLDLLKMTQKTQIYRQHHADVRALVSRIEGLLNLHQIESNAAPIAQVVRDLFGKFGIHLAMEDANLYPRLSQHADPALRDVAQRFQKEMGGLKDRFDRYRQTWPGPLAISANPSTFVEETHQVLSALKQRIGREEDGLYDLYDAAS